MQTFKYFPILFVQGIIADEMNVPILDQGILRNLRWTPSVSEAGTMKTLRSNKEGGFRSTMRDERMFRTLRSMRKRTEDTNNMKTTENFEDKAKNNSKEQSIYVVPAGIKSSLILGNLYEGLTLRYL